MPNQCPVHGQSMDSQWPTVGLAMANEWPTNGQGMANQGNSFPQELANALRLRCHTPVTLGSPQRCLKQNQNDLQAHHKIDKLPFKAQSLILEAVTHRPHGNSRPRHHQSVTPRHHEYSKRVSCNSCILASSDLLAQSNLQEPTGLP